MKVEQRLAEPPKLHALDRHVELGPPEGGGASLPELALREKVLLLHGLPGPGAPGPAPEQPFVEGGDQRRVQSHVWLLVIDPLGAPHGPEHLLLG